MRLHADLPELTPEEVARPWMTVKEALAMAMLRDTEGKRPLRRMFNNLTDRYHIPSIKSGERRPDRRLYSLTSVAMLRTFAELVATGRTYIYARPVADKVADVLAATVRESADLLDAYERADGLRVLYAGVRKGVGRDAPEGAPRVVRVIGDTVPDDLPYLDMGVFAAGAMICGLLRAYVDPWERELRGRL